MEGVGEIWVARGQEGEVELTIRPIHYYDAFTCMY